MHERNIYKIPPNFADLAKKYSFFAPFLQVNHKGAPKINFKDQNALRALTRVLLLEDFQLDVEIPDEVLVPTVPQRLNYILWLEDLLSYNNGFGIEPTQICGIDIGTGATAIYALLAAKKNQWKMIGTEIEPESVMVAKSNVRRNGLDQLVEIRYVKEEGKSVMGKVLMDATPSSQYAFTMCNPPFFGEEVETDSISKSRKETRPHPKGAKTGSLNELVVTGGELEFISQMILDSKTRQNSVRIFTTLVGIKKHLKELISKLKAEGITNFTTTEFSQGKTSRWGLAWTFDPRAHLQPPFQVSHAFENIPGCLNFENYIYAHLHNLKFKCLEWLPNNNVNEEMVVDEIGVGLHFVATESTWTGQRRRRRLLEQAENGPSPRKKVRTTMPENGEEMMDCGTSSIQVELDAEILLEGNVEIAREGQKGTITMRLTGGSLGKDGMNQIMTFLKNCYIRDAQNPETELYQLLQCEKGA